MSAISNLLAAIATLTTLRVVPQLVRTARHQELQGVSILSSTLTGLMSAAWLALGVCKALWPLMISYGIFLVGSISRVVLVPSALGRSRRLALSVFGFGASILALMNASVQAVTVVAVGVSVVALLPQVVDSYRNWCPLAV